MPFNTYTFIIFFIAVLLIHSVLNKWKYQKINLVIASYLFYSAWNPVFIILLYFSTICDWLFAKRIYFSKDKKSKKQYLILSLIVNLGLLGYFKYGEFFLSNSIFFLKLFGVDFKPLAFDIVLPVGISFYTFQTLSYTIDVYRGKIKPGNSFLDYALYVSFFPQLVAGPIVRAGDFLPQCIHPRKASQDQLGWGLSLLVTGLFMKVIIADTVLAPVVDRVYEDPTSFGLYETWTAIFSFSGQIFCDFGGYSTCAIGIALCFGFALPDNFRAPYSAIGFKEFWQRWHISLSSWFRDYFYISMGGNRKTYAKTLMNIFVTMLVAGLWHGASWMFVIWGGLHGVYLIFENILKKYIRVNTNFNSFFQTILILGTYFIVSITWVFFRADDLSNAGLILNNLFNGTRQGIHSLAGFRLAILASVSILVWHIYRRSRSLEYFYSFISPVSRCLLLFSQLLIIFLFASGDDRAFIYFQF